MGTINVDIANALVHLVDGMVDMDISCKPSLSISVDGAVDEEKLKADAQSTFVIALALTTCTYQDIISGLLPVLSVFIEKIKEIHPVSSVSIKAVNASESELNMAKVLLS